MADREQIRDALLLVRCQLGERAAYDELVRAHADMLVRHLRRVAGREAADDLAQEIWLRAFRGLMRLREGARFRPWLLGIAHHVVMDHFRLRYAVSRQEMHDEIAVEGREEEDREAVLAALETGLAALPVTERETLTLFYLEDLTLQQIATIQGVPQGTVKSRMFRARGLLRAAMSPQGEIS